MIFNQTNNNKGAVNNTFPRGIRFEGEFIAELFDADGSRIWRRRIRNSVLDGGLTDILGVYFASGTQKPSWSLGLIDSNNFVQVANSDTMALHPGWVENLNYSQTTRAAWTPSVGGGVASNAASQVFTFTRAASLAGMFVASSSTKGGTSGTLFSAAALGVPAAYAAGQILRLSYSLRAVGGG